MSAAFDDLKKFFETSSIAAEALHSVSNGREIAILLDGTPLTLTRQNGKNQILNQAAKAPDFIFSLTSATATELANKNFESVGQVGLHIFEKILSNNPDQKIGVQLHAGVLTLVTQGYFGVLSAGGAEVMKYLATHGFGSLGKIKDALGKLKKK